MDDKSLLDFYVKRQRHEETAKEWRDDFSKDRDRIVHSRAFRKLQTKTQMFGTVWMPHFFSRCTHSLQVSQIGRTIAKKVLHDNPTLPKMELHPELIEAICLAHDIGHPPFGHAGEKVLNKKMESFGGFEGNAQTFRELTCNAQRKKDHEGQQVGLNLSRATLLGILKYPWTHEQAKEEGESKFSIYQDLASSYGNWLFDSLEPPAGGFLKFRKEAPKTLACSIMDIADTIAYSVHDLQDAFASGFLRSDKVAGDEFRYYMRQFYLDKCGGNSNDFEQHLKRIRMDLANAEPGPFGQTKPWMEISAELIREFIEALEMVDTDFAEPFHVRLKMDESTKGYMDFLRFVVRRFVVLDVRVKQAAHQSELIISKLFDAFFDIKDLQQFDFLNILHSRGIENLAKRSSEAAKARYICDLIYSMSEGQAIETYQRLFTPKSLNPYAPIV